MLFKIKFNNNYGFTLIELLIVICIIGILLTFAVPMYGDYKERAYIASMKIDINSIRNAQELYYTDNDKYLIIDELPGELSDFGNKNLSQGNSAKVTSTDEGKNNFTITISSVKTLKKVIFNSNTGLISVK